MSNAKLTTWKDFTARYRDEWLSGLRSVESRSESLRVLNRFGDTMCLEFVEEATAAVLSDYLGRRRSLGLSESTINTEQRRIVAALGWGHTVDLVSRVPKLRRQRASKDSKVMKGRPLAGEEFERMLSVISQVRKHDADDWTFYLRGLWLSGLRLEESLSLCWEQGAPLWLDQSGKEMVLRIEVGGDKSGEARVLPLTPDFIDFLLATPQRQQRGRVFKVRAVQTGRFMSVCRVCRVIADIGRKAGVVVNKQGNKFASAHDLRRTFGTRWARRVTQAELQQLMRHESYETTAKYYVDISAERLTADLRERESHTATDKVWLPSSGQIGEVLP